MKYALVPSIVGRPDRYFSFTRVVFFWPRYRASFPGVIKDPPANCFMSFSICFVVMVSPSVLKLRFCGVFFFSDVVACVSFVRCSDRVFR